MKGFARALGEAEQRLRAAGLTADAAFDALRDTLLARLGSGGAEHPALAGLALPVEEGDLLGLAYERFFPDLFKGRVGQFFTPASVGELLVARLPLGPGVTALDPTCGSGGLLVLAGRTGARVRGMDVDPRMVDLARLNLGLSGLDGPVVQGDFFAAPPDPVDVVVANPPFSVDVRDPGVLARYALAEGAVRASSDVLFMEALERWVKPGGLAGIVIPWTLVANASAERVRARVDGAFRRLALCALPEGVFRPFGGAAGRAAVLWLQRRPCADGPMAYAELEDPGYDVRSTALKPTGTGEIDALRAGRGWRDLDGWLPEAPATAHPPLSAWIGVDTDAVVLDGEASVADLADADRATGELLPRQEAVQGRRAVLKPGQVLVSRMRPALGNVALVPPGPEHVGSPEWIRLVPTHHAHYAFHALRSPAWRAQLPPTTGQTRPRTDPETVLATAVPMPGTALLDRIEALSAGLLEARRRSRARLLALQEAIDAYVSGELDEAALGRRLAELEAE
ncbi:MAG: SAM-dependent DNA methyltransferase [Alphaproteobacteria bacterium]|nr:SAM-dependent DNA methyltransferase [Alphaproteobacteria bacterium]